MKLPTIIGTRPEAIKMAPVLLELRGRTGVTSRLCCTGQHVGAVESVLDFFDIRPDLRLTLMPPDGSLSAFIGRAVPALHDLIVGEKPDRLIVQGDTATAWAAAQAAFNSRIPIVHVEAGLRTHDREQPWPEEQYRQWIDHCSDLLLAPTRVAAANLERESATGRIAVTGNSGVDALHLILARLRRDRKLREQADALLPRIDPDSRLVLVTTHRRESIGSGIRDICVAIADLAARETAEFVLPLHGNPAVHEAVREALGERRHVHLLQPLPGPAMVRLMQRADLIITDSGGMQEEAISLHKPLLVLRDKTERPEGIEAGSAQLVGRDPARIVAQTIAALKRIGTRPLRPVVRNPYGDGRASLRIVAALFGEPFEEFGPDRSDEQAASLRLAV